MKVWYIDKWYETIYYPFYRINESPEYFRYNIKLPSGINRTFTVYDKERVNSILYEYLENLLVNYALEDDLALTDKGKELKNESRTLFGL